MIISRPFVWPIFGTPTFRSVLLAQKEKQLSSALLQKDNEIFMLRADLAQLQDHQGSSPKDIHLAVKNAIARRYHPRTASMRQVTATSPFNTSSDGRRRFC